ncbi:MAG: mannose-1-phosphate guanylyltransferase/mannose-6-phosphate isomerase [Candidatus Omnitrophica bacterium]|nr:mannose-1-phosphate guanylyltransferase/mannose-6-phosphate isomerase [Candidatus Omnitrophota bacterium]
MKIIILAGGKGTRLWPLSREKHAKQFLKLVDQKTLLEATYERVLKLASAGDIVTITNKDYYFYVKDICEKFSSALAKNIICEPVGRNTAPAIALGIQFILDKLHAGQGESVFIFPSDQVIKPMEKFIAYMRKAAAAAEKGYLVTLGIKPTKPETGYGYIKTGKSLGDCNVCEKFTEKPNLPTAKKYLASKKFLWNAGIFAFRIDAFLSQLKILQPQIYKNISKGYDRAVARFNEMPSISVDYAVMEKAKNVAVVNMDVFWTDLGSWDSFYEMGKKDEDGNALIGHVYTVGTKNSLVFSNKRMVTTVGMDDTIVVETDDAVLVASRGKTQDVKKLLDELKKSDAEELNEHTESHRPWGTYKVLEKSPRYKIKKIMVKPKETLSLQLHHHRSEHWVVIKGTAEVTVGKKTFYVHEGESTFVPKSTTHRLANPGNVPLEIIEVQNGESVVESDIVRFKDKYKR